MAQRKQLTWSELRVGLFVLVGLLILAVGIFYVTGVGIFGPKYRIKTYLPEVSGLSTGAPVRLDGVNVGTVDQIRLVKREPGKPPERMHNIEVVMRIDRNYKQDILTDSAASLVTEGLLGNRYVTISRGYTGVPIEDGQVVPGTEEKAIKEVVERSADVLSNLKALSDDVQDIIDGVQRGKGTLGKLLTDDQAYVHLNSILNKGDQIVSNVQAGQGTVGRLFMSDDTSVKADKALDQLNTILADLRAQKGTMGKLLYDPTLYDQAKEAITNSNAVLADVRAGKGTFGKLATDETLYNKLRDTSSNLSDATAKLNQNNNTAGKLFSDPQLYDNLTAVTGDMRKLIGDFRTNPKKFLHIKVTLF
jgi:phospholipid/cholesterol/gamma-HCH transport system substrate-binding protein